MLLRHLLLFLAARKGLRRWMETSPLAGRLTARFIAGETLDEALKVCQSLDQHCALLTLDRLGENVTSLEDAAASRDGYLEAMRRVGELGLPASVSIKLTQFGMDVSEEICRLNVTRLVEAASRYGNWIEIDMESSDYVDRTLRLVVDLHRSYANIRGVVQAYLRRSATDVEALCREGVPVRLCKGAYREPEAIAYQKKREVDSSYVRLMKTLLERGVYPGIATHDAVIIAETKRFASERGIPAGRWEFQMLYGIRRDLEQSLIQEGYRLRLYVPYGESWFPYFMRRLAERPANLMFLLRNLLRG